MKGRWASCALNDGSSHYHYNCDELRRVAGNIRSSVELFRLKNSTNAEQSWIHDWINKIWDSESNARHNRRQKEMEKNRRKQNVRETFWFKTSGSGIFLSHFLLPQNNHRQFLFLFSSFIVHYTIAIEWLCTHPVSISEQRQQQQQQQLLFSTLSSANTNIYKFFGMSVASRCFCFASAFCLFCF